MAKQIVCAELSGETTPSFLWEDFKNGNENIRDHLSGLGCVMEEVLIISTGNNFFILAISSGVNPLLMFFRSFHLENYLKLQQTTSESINYLMDGLGVKKKFTSSSLRTAFKLASEEGSLGPTFRHLFGLLLANKIALPLQQDLMKQIQEIVNRSFVCA